MPMYDESGKAIITPKTRSTYQAPASIITKKPETKIISPSKPKESIAPVIKDFKSGITPVERQLIDQAPKPPSKITSGQQLRVQATKELSGSVKHYKEIDPEATYVYESGEQISGKELKQQMGSGIKQSLLGITKIQPGMYVETGGQHYRVTGETRYLIEHAEPKEKEKLIASFGKTGYEGLPSGFVGPVIPPSYTATQEAYGSLTEHEKEYYGYTYTPFIDQPIEEWKYYPGGSKYYGSLSKEQKEKHITTFVKEHKIEHDPWYSFGSTWRVDGRVVEGLRTKDMKDVEIQRHIAREEITMTPPQIKEHYYSKLPPVWRNVYSVGHFVSKNVLWPVTLAQTGVKVITRGKTILPDISQELTERQMGPSSKIETTIGKVFGADVSEMEKIQEKYPLATISATGGELFGLWLGGATVGAGIGAAGKLGLKHTVRYTPKVYGKLTTFFSKPKIVKISTRSQAKLFKKGGGQIVYEKFLIGKMDAYGFTFPHAKFIAIQKGLPKTRVGAFLKSKSPFNPETFWMRDSKNISTLGHELLHNIYPTFKEKAIVEMEKYFAKGFTHIKSPSFGKFLSHTGKSIKGTKFWQHIHGWSSGKLVKVRLLPKAKQIFYKGSRTGIEEGDITIFGKLTKYRGWGKREWVSKEIAGRTKIGEFTSHTHKFLSDTYRGQPVVTSGRRLQIFQTDIIGKPKGFLWWKRAKVRSASLRETERYGTNIQDFLIGAEPSEKYGSLVKYWSGQSPLNIGKEATSGSWMRYTPIKTVKKPIKYWSDEASASLIGHVHPTSYHPMMTGGIRGMGSLGGTPVVDFLAFPASKFAFPTISSIALGSKVIEGMSSAQVLSSASVQDLAPLSISKQIQQPSFDTRNLTRTMEEQLSASILADDMMYRQMQLQKQLTTPAQDYVSAVATRDISLKTLHHISSSGKGVKLPFGLLDGYTSKKLKKQYIPKVRGKGYRFRTWKVPTMKDFMKGVF